MVYDRSFAENPPLCIRDELNFQFGQSTYGQLGAQAVKLANEVLICFEEVQDWIKEEEKSREIGQDSTEGA